MEETLVFGNLSQEGVEVVSRNGRYFIRYDAGAHQIAWREDELTQKEFEQLKNGHTDGYQALLALQRRIERSGGDPYQQNWEPNRD